MSAAAKSVKFDSIGYSNPTSKKKKVNSGTIGPAAARALAQIRLTEKGMEAAAKSSKLPERTSANSPPPPPPTPAGNQK